MDGTRTKGTLQNRAKITFFKKKRLILPTCEIFFYISGTPMNQCFALVRPLVEFKAEQERKRQISIISVKSKLYKS